MTFADDAAQLLLMAGDSTTSIPAIPSLLVLPGKRVSQQGLSDYVSLPRLGPGL
jgi:hypothetical protein